VRSGTLDLHVSLEQARELWATATRDSPSHAVSFLQFLPIVRQLVLLAYTSPEGIGATVYGESDSPWIQIGWSSDDPGALPIYLNKVRTCRGSLAARQPGSEAAWQRGSLAARQPGSEAAWQRGSLAARRARRVCRVVARTSKGQVDR